MPKKRQRLRSTVPNSQPLENILNRKPREKDDSQHIIQSRDGDYLEGIESTDWDTVKFFYRWTEHRDFAEVFTGDHLFSKDGLMSLLVQGFPGVTAIQIKEGTTKKHA